MTARHRLALRLVLLAASSLAAAALGAWALARLRPKAPTVREVDQSADYERLLAERAAEHAARALPGEPHAPRVFFTDDPDVRARLIEVSEASVRGSHLTDPRAYYVRAPGLSLRKRFDEHPDGGWRIVTNDHGTRDDEDVAVERPDLRVLVTGDSHTEGVCANAESFTNRLEARLAAAGSLGSVECLNAGVGGYHLYHYLGVLERWIELLPVDVFIVTIYGGNDYAGAVKFQRYFDRGEMYAKGPYEHMELRSTFGGEGGLPSQELSQTIYFLNNPGDEVIAAETTLAILRRMDELARAAGIALIAAYLPPPLHGQPRLYAQERARAASILGVEEERLACSDRITDAWIADLSGSGIEVLDLRPVLDTAEERLYWESDHHIDLEGHERVAAALQPIVERLAARGRER